MSVLGPLSLLVVGFLLSLGGVLLILDSIASLGVCIALDDRALEYWNPWRTRRILLAWAMLELLVGIPMLVYGYLFLTA